jgi:hypothetical protein
MLEIVPKAEVLLIEFDGAAKIVDVNRYVIDALEHCTVLLSPKDRLGERWLQASEKAPARE